MLVKRKKMKLPKLDFEFYFYNFLYLHTAGNQQYLEVSRTREWKNLRFTWENRKTATLKLFSFLTHPEVFWNILENVSLSVVYWFFLDLKHKRPRRIGLRKKIEFSYWLALTATIMVCMVPPVIPRIFVAFWKKSNVARNYVYRTRSQNVKDALKKPISTMNTS